MKVLITGGPTREPIDAVRFISNRSSGRMSVAIAQAAADAGHETTLLLGPVEPLTLQELPQNRVAVHRFETAAQLQKLLETHWPNHDTLIMAAAVADYRPTTPQQGKLPRQANQNLTLHLEPTPDIVASMATNKRPGQRIIAFALEENKRLEERATEKRRRKGVDAIIANPLETMDADTISPVWLTATGQREAPGTLAKTDFARWLIAKFT